MQEPERRPAEDYYRVVVERESVGRMTRLVRSVVATATILIPVYWLLDNQEPRLRTTVRVVRKHDGQVVAEYEYNRESEAMQHARDLDDRMKRMPYRAFSDDLGVRDF